MSCGICFNEIKNKHDAVLVATGRIPKSKELNLESIGVETNRGFIPIDDKMRALKNQKYYTAGSIVLMFLVLLTMYLILGN